MAQTVAKRAKMAKRERKAAQDRQAQVELLESYSPNNLRWNNLDWVVVGWIGAMHLGCLAAPFFFTWEALAVALVLHWATGSLGICLGYHRYLSHKGFKLSRPAQFLVYLCGCLSAEGSPLTWAATHRVHHARSDQDGDPHSPLDGPWWSHILWLFIRRTPEQKKALFEKYVPDIAHDPLLNFFERTFILWSFALAAVLYWAGGWPMVIWGMCVRMVAMYHSTWFVNSATHLWGYRTYQTSDQSRNLWWVAVVSYGEGWHNNHHAHPVLARAGHRWWEFDPTFWAIRVLQFFGQAWDVRDEIPERPYRPRTMKPREEKHPVAV